MQNDPNLVEFHFEVVDTDTEILKEKLMSMFESYVQVNNGQDCTGLGLRIVQSFVSYYYNMLYTYIISCSFLYKIKFCFKWMVYVDLDHRPRERGTCFTFNVLLKIREVQQPHDIEEGP